MSESKRTTKYVTGKFKVTYYGDYYAPDEITGNLTGILDDSLNDRDDVRSWEFTVNDIEVHNGDPEGYDA